MKQKVILFGALLLLVLILILYNSSFFYKFSKRGAISRLQQVITRNDAGAVVSLIRSSDTKLKINEKTIQSFLTYLKKNPDKLQELLNNLHKQAVFFEGKKNQECWNYYLLLKKSDTGFPGLDKYYFEMKPCYVDLSTNYISTRLYIDNKYIFTPDGSSTNSHKICGPFVQGTHNVKAACESFLGKSENSQDFNFITTFSPDGSTNNYVCQIPINDTYVFLSSNFDAEVFVNGKDTGKTTSDYNLFGPVKPGTYVKAYAEKTFPWGKFKSRESTIDTYSQILDMCIDPATDEIVNQLKSAIAYYNRDIIAAALKCRSTRIPSILFYDNGHENSFEDAIEKEYKVMSSKGIYFSGSYVSSVLDLKSISMYYIPENDAYYASLTSTDYYNQDYGEADSVIRTSKHGIKNEYTIEYDVKSKKWSANKFVIIDDKT